jgi:hypothetical protein
MGSQFQMLGFYLAGFLCLALAVLKLTSEGQWSWWRVLLPLWVVLGHNALYIVVGFVWLSYAGEGEAEGTSIRQHEGTYAYQVIALLCFVVFADNLLGRSQGTGMNTWCGFRSGWWPMIGASVVLSLVWQLLFWSTVFPETDRRSREE